MINIIQIQKPNYKHQINHLSLAAADKLSQGGWLPSQFNEVLLHRHQNVLILFLDIVDGLLK